MVAVTSFSIRCKLSPTVAEVIKIDKLQAQFKECQPPYLNTYFFGVLWGMVFFFGWFRKVGSCSTFEIEAAS